MRGHPAHGRIAVLAGMEALCRAAREKNIFTYKYFSMLYKRMTHERDIYLYRCDHDKPMALRSYTVKQSTAAQRICRKAASSPTWEKETQKSAPQPEPV